MRMISPEERERRERRQKILNHAAEIDAHEEAAPIVEAIYALTQAVCALADVMEEKR